MEEIKTRFGKCNVEKTGVEYQIVAYYNKLDADDIPELNTYFNKIGKYEKILKGTCVLFDSLGISHPKDIPELTDEDFDNIEIAPSGVAKRKGCIDIFIRSRELNKYEQRYSTERLSLKPENIAKMIDNIEKYEALIKSKKALVEL
ncbi:MAG: hypothetical protein MUO82_02375 [Candidatus Thermoplasmatota archaeon]|nr:hypothetical protein [Candidatus Thermoplasmatota archaeon]